jgi:hypothetical protein
MRKIDAFKQHDAGAVGVDSLVDETLSNSLFARKIIA